LDSANNLYYKLDDSIVGSILAYTEITANENGFIIDLSTINLTTYPNDLIVTYKLERDGTGDTSPTISNHSVTWEGALELGWAKLDEALTVVNSSALSVPCPTGYEEYKLILEGKSHTANTRLIARINNDSSAGAYTFMTVYTTDDVDPISATSISISTVSAWTTTTESRVEINLRVPTSEYGGYSYSIEHISLNSSINQQYVLGGYESTDAISTLDFPVNIASGTRWKLYGRNL
jgi:hypothetical protein